MAEKEKSARDRRACHVGWTTLWLPLPDRRNVWIATALVGLFYLLTMSRDLSFYDSAEFAIVACQGGLSHPPGHPLHTLLGWLAAHLTWFRPLLGLNALSAIPAALALVPVCSMAWLLTSGEQGQEGPRWLPRRVSIPALAAVIALHPALWESATRVEVYTLAASLALWSIARAVTIIDRKEKRAIAWLPVGIVFGLGASTNPVVATGAALGLSPAIISGLIRRHLHWKSGFFLVLGGVAGLLPYVYVPLVAGREDVFVWGAPTGGEALRRFVTGADFAHKQSITLVTIAANAVEWLAWVAEQGLVPLLTLGLLAHVLWGGAAGLGRMAALLTFGMALIFISMKVTFFPQISDYMGYMVLPLSMMSAGTAALVARIAVGGEWRPLLATILAAALLISVVTAPPWILSRRRSQDRLARLLSTGVLENAPRGAIVIVSSDHWVFPMLYLQEVEHLRPDIILLPRGLSGASWYWAHLQRKHSELNSFELRGPGGQPARIRRFLAANPSRPKLFENWEQASSIGIQPFCVGTWLLRDETACGRERAATHDELTPLLEAQLELIGHGSPTTDAVIANVALARGEMLWRLGQSDSALRALRAGVPSDLLPSLNVGSLTAPPLDSGLPNWQQKVAIGTPGRNLFVAAHLLRAAGANEAAQAHFIAAARANLTEALLMAQEER